MIRYQPQPTGVFPRLKGLGQGLFCFCIIFSVLIMINVLQLLTLILRVFSSRLFRFINRCFAYFWWGLVVVWFERFYSTRLVFTGDFTPKKENVMVIANHQGITDIPVLMSLAWRKRRLGDLKWFVKDIIKYVPGPGWGMLFLGCVFVKRNWFADKENIHRIFDGFLRNIIPIWLISFLEGTRITDKKLEKSQRFAQNKGLPILQNVLIPRTKGFSAAISVLRSHLDAIYDVTIGYSMGIPLAWQFVEGQIGEVHVHVRRYRTEEIPVNEVDMNQWVLERFQEKDRQLSHFNEKGCFNAKVIEEPFW